MSLIEVIVFLLAVTFIAELIIIVIVQQFRAREYKKAKWKQPRLLPRERLLFGTALFTIGLISLRRVLELNVTDDIWWILLTGLPIEIALVRWIWDELELGGEK